MQREKWRTVDSESMERVVKVAADISEMAPETARQMLEWTAARDWLALIVFGSLAFLVGLPSMLYFIRNWKLGRRSDEFLDVVAAFCLVGAVLLALFVCTPAACELYKISIAPNLVVLEQFVGMLK